MRNTGFQQSIWSTLSAVPKSTVISYGDLARIAGWPNYARQAGAVLNSLPEGTDLPWHRVVKSSGHLAFPENSQAYLCQRARLEAEGVEFTGKKLNYARYRWRV